MITTNDSAITDIKTMAANTHAGHLFEAIRCGDVQKAGWLLDGGVGTEVQNAEGDRPLHAASSGGSVEMVRLLLGRGADVLAKNPRTLATALHGVFENATLDPLGKALAQEKFRSLLEHGADLNAKDARGRTPMTCLLACFGTAFPFTQIYFKTEMDILTPFFGAMDDIIKKQQDRIRALETYVETIDPNASGAAGTTKLTKID